MAVGGGSDKGYTVNSHDEEGTTKGRALEDLIFLGKATRPMTASTKFQDIFFKKL